MLDTKIFPGFKEVAGHILIIISKLSQSEWKESQPSVKVRQTVNILSLTFEDNEFFQTHFSL
jgi:hypothetical protein